MNCCFAIGYQSEILGHNSRDHAQSMHSDGASAVHGAKDTIHTNYLSWRVTLGAAIAMVIMGVGEHNNYTT
jgi:hypothetical protein